ncbi:MAG: DUF1349 domain-containing protein [Propionibacteriaceae bacterium]|jgi:regulation of enolase protein 1 (concanavalin A-like superfamily)|nr:DUF1349 domain-containing protein [Propionibacteriaceae bacterium]
MNRPTPRRLSAALVAASLALAGLAVSAPPAAAAGVNLPVFAYSGTITTPSAVAYNPTGEFIFPSVFHAGEYFDDPLGEWYLYYAPHDAPGGISLMYADSLTGPWTEYAGGNPLIGKTWAPYYSVSHVSTPDAYWSEEEGQMFMYFHGENSTTRWATSTDGITFTYGGVALNTNMVGASIGNTVTEVSYARVFDHPDTDGDWDYAMFFMCNKVNNVRDICLAFSNDLRTWQTQSRPIVEPGTAEGQNVSSADLLEWDGQYFIAYHSSAGDIFAREINPELTEVGYKYVLHEPMSAAPDSGRAASPQVVADQTGTYLFYEAGARLSATIAYATLDPDLPRPADPVQDGPNEPSQPGELADPRLDCAGVGSDDFEGAELDQSIWPTLTNPGSARHTVSEGALRVPTYNTGMAGASIPLQPMPAGAWEMTAAVTLTPTAGYHQAGLVLYQDGTNYAKVDIERSGTGAMVVELIKRTNGTDRNAGGTDSQTIAWSGGQFWVRLISDGANITAAYSLDGEKFISIGRPASLSASFAPIGVGPFAMQGPTSVGELTAVFDWVQFAPSADELAVCEAEQPAVADAVSLTGPETATVGTASEEFTVTPSGPFNGTLTPAAGSGTFSPASLTWVDSASPQTFTFTPDAPGTVSITLDGLGGLALDPPAGVVVEVAAGEALALSAEFSTKCMAGKAYLSVRAFNDSQVPVELTITTLYGAKTFASIAPAKSGLQAFTSQAGSYPAGEIAVSATALGDSGLTGQATFAYPAGSCG